MINIADYGPIVSVSGLVTTFKCPFCKVQIFKCEINVKIVKHYTRPTKFGIKYQVVS